MEKMEKLRRVSQQGQAGAIILYQKREISICLIR